MQQPNDLSRAYQLAQSPAGKQLLNLLQQTGGSELQAALAQASAGDFTQAQKTLSGLLDTPEAQKLLAQLGGNK